METETYTSVTAKTNCPRCGKQFMNNELGRQVHEKRCTGQPPNTFKLQVHIPLELYYKMLGVAGHEGEEFHGRIYGGFSKIVTLALRQYLSKVPDRIKPLPDEEI